MKKLNELKNYYNSLNFEQQGEVAKIIAESSKDRQYHFMEKEEDMAKVNNFFERIIKSVKQKQVIEGKPSIIKRFKELSQVNKEKALSSIIEIIESAIKDQEKENNEKICRQEGHIFNKWEKIEYEMPVYIGSEKDYHYDRNGYKKSYTKDIYETQNVIKWRRYCQRCGYIEKSLEEPDELIEERLEIERQEKIKKLKKELKELTSIDNNKKG